MEDTLMKIMLDKPFDVDSLGTLRQIEEHNPKFHERVIQVIETLAKEGRHPRRICNYTAKKGQVDIAYGVYFTVCITMLAKKPRKFFRDHSSVDVIVDELRQADK